MTAISEKLGILLRDRAYLLCDTEQDYDPLLKRIGDTPFVLIGEASHGTHEFYKARAEITKRLIKEKGFTAVAIEGDWPDAYRVNRYVHSNFPSISSVEALVDFKRFPTWMWRNTEVVEFIEWLQNHNARLSPDAIKTGFYGLDLYSLHRSMNAVVEYLESVDPQAAQQARQRYSCFDHFGEDPQLYGYYATANPALSCKSQVIEQLVQLQKNALNYMKIDGFLAEDEFFYAEQNAIVVKDAEHYYRTLFEGSDENCWNLRDRHMMRTLEALVKHLERRQTRAKVVVWAHNSHIGDARATEMLNRHEVNIGQLAREH